MSDEGFVSIRGVRRVYTEGRRSRAVLDGLDLELKRGEYLALLGRSGSGKSSLLNLVSGIDAPDAGSVVIDGVDLTALNERSRTLFRRAHIGFVYQFFNLIPTLDVEENVRLPLELNGIAAVPARERALAVLEEVGLADRAGAFPDRLSGGEQQRVAIARALAHGPALVLADEPTGNLDADSGARVLALLDRMVRSHGLTLILVTHARQVAAHADRAMELADGRLRPASADSAW